MNKVKNKIAHYNLNLDYKNSHDIETQTNFLINNIMNDFVTILKTKDLNKVKFVYEYNDDLLSLIGYHILLNIQSIVPEFNFKLYGKKKRTRKFLIKKQKFCSSFELKRKKDDIFLISSFNPIYKVINQKYSYNKIVSLKYNLLNSFTPQEIETAQLFYHIGYIKNDLLCKKFIKEREDFSAWIEKPTNEINENILNFYGYDYPSKIILAWFDEDVNNNISIMQDLQDETGLVFYYFNQKPEILFDETYSWLVKNKTNMPNEAFLNINEYDIPKILKYKYGKDFQTVGNWKAEDLKRLEE